MSQEKNWIIDDGYWSSDTSPIKNYNVHDHKRTYTGVLDSQGRAIYKEPNEIGFGRKQGIYSV